jgi:hypothetical protein
MKVKLSFAGIRVLGKLEGKTEITYEDSERQTLTISSELAKELGFQNTAFSPGVHVSESTQNYSYYDTIPKTALYQISLYKWKKLLTPVEEPAEHIIDDL